MEEIIKERLIYYSKRKKEILEAYKSMEEQGVVPNGAILYMVRGKISVLEEVLKIISSNV